MRNQEHSYPIRIPSAKTLKIIEEALADDDVGLGPFSTPEEAIKALNAAISDDEEL